MIDRPDTDLTGASLFVSAGPAIATAFGHEEVRVLHGPALAAIIAERLQQIARHGHDLETDRLRGPALLAHQARSFLHAAIEQLQPGARQALGPARKNIVRAAAMALAALDAFPDQIGVPHAPKGGGSSSGCSPAAPAPLAKITGKSPAIGVGEPPSQCGVDPALAADFHTHEGNPDVND